MLFGKYLKKYGLILYEVNVTFIGWPVGYSFLDVSHLIRLLFLRCVINEIGVGYAKLETTK